MARSLTLVLLLLAGCSRLNPIAPECVGCRGQPCGDAGQCQSGHCVDGVCCDSACDAPCDRCNLEGALGTCGVAPAGDLGAPPCSPYVCGGAASACPATCAADAECAPGHWCSGGACVPTLAAGSSCARAGACQSGHCADGVCCDTACNQPCDRCDLTGSVGTCRIAPAGSPSAPSCAPYACSGTAAGCPPSCTGDGDCVDGGYCNASSACAFAQPSGQPCTRPAQCQSGFCVDGFCCADACAAPCATCGGATPGTCSTADAGAAGRPACAPYLCGGGSTACPSSCTSNGNCAPGFACSPSTATPSCLADQDSDGTANADDCAPSDPGRYVLRACFADLDGDTVFSPTSAPTCSGAACPPSTRADAGTDCDDADAGGWQVLTCSFGLDGDGDGYRADPGLPTCAGAGCPAGSSSLRDCDDDNGSARPGQLAYFTAARDGGSFDYDCSGTETKDPGWDCLTGYAGTASCAAVAYTGQRGWVSAVPGCGDAGTWRTCASWENATCNSPTWWFGGCGTGCVFVDGGTSFSVQETTRLMPCR